MRWKFNENAGGWCGAVSRPRDVPDESCTGTETEGIETIRVLFRSNAALCEIDSSRQSIVDLRVYDLLLCIYVAGEF